MGVDPGTPDSCLTNTWYDADSLCASTTSWRPAARQYLSVIISAENAVAPVLSTHWHFL